MTDEKLGVALTSATASLGERLYKQQLGAILEKLTAACLAKLTELKTATTLATSKTVSVTLEELGGIKKDDLYAGSKPTQLHRDLEEWAAKEKLKLWIGWHHGGCSYCENCDSSCYPTKVCIEWADATK